MASLQLGQWATVCRLPAAGILLVNSSAKNVARVCNIMPFILKFCIVKPTRMHFGYNLPFQAG
jgi:hypothetical protein